MNHALTLAHHPVVRVAMSLVIAGGAVSTTMSTGTCGDTCSCGADSEGAPGVASEIYSRLVAIAHEFGPAITVLADHAEEDGTEYGRSTAAGARSLMGRLRQVAADAEEWLRGEREDAIT